MDKIMELAKAIASSQTPKNKTSSYDTTATVKRIEGNTAWIHISDGVPETPAVMAINAKEGDTVRVNVSGGGAYIIGNVDNPPTDDSYAKQAEAQALRAAKAADSASVQAGVAKRSADSALKDAATAKESAAKAVTDASTAKESAAQAVADAATAHDAAEAAQDSANAAQTSADNALVSAQNASEYASRALGNLSTVQSVTETLNWITAHGTMTLTSDVALDPTHVYFVVDANGDYVVGGTHYSVVTEPNIADISTYYELSIDESLNNYVGTHLAVTSEGLWLLPDAGGNKVLIATGQGSTYTSAGTYIIGKDNGLDVVLATFGADGVQIGVEGEAVLEMDSRSLKLVNKEGEAYFQVSNLKDEHEDYKRTEQHIGWNMQLSINGVNYYAVGLNEYAGSVESVSVNGTPKSSPTDYILYNDPVYGFSLVCFVANIGTTAVVDVVYYTDSGALKAYTIGIREQDSDVGLFSIAEGRYVEASGYYSHAQNIGTIANTFGQTAIGIYNDTPNSNAAFIIGNGNNDVSRSTAFVVEWDGNIQMALSTTAASGTDHDLYAAITALGWQSDVIV